MVSGIGIVTYLESVKYEKKDKSGTVEGILVHCVVHDDNMHDQRFDSNQILLDADDERVRAEAIVALNTALLTCKVCRCWCSNKPDSVVNGLAVGDKVEIRYGKYGEYITRVVKENTAGFVQ